MKVAEHDEYRILTKRPGDRSFKWIPWVGAGPWSTQESAQKSIDSQVNSLIQGYQFRIQYRHVRIEATEWASLKPLQN